MGGWIQIFVCLATTLSFRDLFLILTPLQELVMNQGLHYYRPGSASEE